jgi:hypothetical protein
MRIIFVIASFFLLVEITRAQTPVSFYLDEGTLSSTCKFSDDHIYFALNGNVVKTDFQGNVIWSKSNLPFPEIFAGSFYYSLVGNGTIARVAKCDTSGNVIWAKDISATVCPQYNADYNDIGGIFVKGNRMYISSAQYNLQTGYDGLSALITLDTSGNVINSWCDPNVILSDYITRGFSSMAGGGWFVYVLSGSGMKQAIVKMNYDGTVDSTTSTVSLISSHSVNAIEIITLMDSNYMAICNTYGDGSFPISNQHIVLCKFQESGSVIWQEIISAIPFNDTAFQVNGATLDSSGNIYIVGEMYGDLWGHKNFLMKLNALGQISFIMEWTDALMNANIKTGKLFFKNGFICCSSTLRDSAQHKPVIIVFDTAFNACNVPDQNISVNTTPDLIWNSVWPSYPPINYTIFSDTITINTAVDPLVNDLCLTLTVSNVTPTVSLEIFPNPFENKISIHLESNEKVLVSVYNLTGSKKFEMNIVTDAEVDLSDLPSGVYQLSITSASLRLSKKIIKI